MRVGTGGSDSTNTNEVRRQHQRVIDDKGSCSPVMAQSRKRRKSTKPVEYRKMMEEFNKKRAADDLDPDSDIDDDDESEFSG